MQAHGFPALYELVRAAARGLSPAAILLTDVSTHTLQLSVCLSRSRRAHGPQMENPISGETVSSKACRE